jgi:uncharacterized protein YxjI
MRYVLQEKFFSLPDSFTIRDEGGRDAFVVSGRLLSFGKQWDFADANGTQLAFIRQRLIALTPTYEIYRDDKLFASVQKHMFTLFRAKFTVDVPGPDDLEASGDFLDHEYKFSRSGETVAEVSKQWFTFRDTYGVDIREGEDDVLILASAVVIDAVSHPDPR